MLLHDKIEYIRLFLKMNSDLHAQRQNLLQVMMIQIQKMKDVIRCRIQRQIYR